ncbi:heterodisulfide reductase-related iron-sulfur binding cluster [Verticiella sediminum]|nr:heterodisulfide reductase-related iron-sulfur binding cluster [Verticiella sediminum]
MSSMKNTIAIHRIDHVRAEVDKCAHFGFCTAVCPTYVLDGDEHDSPRGRIALAKEMLAHDGPPSALAVKHLDRCLSCLSCETTCAAGVSYREIIDGARQHIEASGVRPLPQRALRSLVARTLTTPALLRPAVALATRLPGVAARMPGPLGALAGLARAPGLAALKGRSAAPPVRNDAPPQRRVALLSGCAQSVLGAEINDAALRLLARAGIHVQPTPAGLCCGALDLHMGRRKPAVRHMLKLVRTLDAALAEGRIDAVLATTSGCMSVMQHYDEVLSDHPERREAGARVKHATRDVTQFAQELALAPTGAAAGLIVSYHDACSLNHGLRLKRPPRQALRDAGLQVRDIAEAHLCCGSAGTYNILQPEISERLGRRKAMHAANASPDVIAAGNMGCLVQMSRYTDVPVAHTVQLLDWATGGPAPRGLEHYVPRAVVAEEAPAVPETANVTADAGDSFW